MRAFACGALGALLTWAPGAGAAGWASPPVAPQSPYVTSYPSVTLEPEAQTYLNAVRAAGATPSNDYVAAVNEFIGRAKAHGSWSGCDRLWLLGGQASKAIAYADMKSGAAMSDGTAAPGFTSFGLMFDGVAQFAATNFNPTTNGVNFTLNSASIHVFAQANASSAFGYLFGAGNVRLVWQASGAAHPGVVGGMVNAATYVASANNSGTAVTGLLSYSRVAAGAASWYVNGDFLASDGTASTAIDNAVFLLGNATPASFWAGTASFAAVCGGMSALQVKQLNDDVTLLLQRLGVAPKVLWNNSPDLVTNPAAGTTCAPNNAVTPYAYNRYGGVHRFEIRQGDQWATDIANAHIVDRDEVGCSTPTTATGAPAWVDYHVLFEQIPATGDGSTWDIISQMHQAAGVGPAAASPPFSLQLRPCVTSGWCFTAIICTAGFTCATVYQGTVPIVANHAYWVWMQVTEDPALGAVTLWIDGVQAYAGANLAIGYAADAAYWKFGWYRDYNIPSTWAFRIINPKISTTTLVSEQAAPPFPLPALNN